MKKAVIKGREGASLAIVICVAAFLTAFSLALLYAAGLGLSRANRRLEQERSYQLARSFSEVLEQELMRYRHLQNGRAPEGTDPGLIAPETGETFYQYTVRFLEGQYGAYDPNHPDETIFHFTAGEVSGGADAEDYGEIRVAMYKEASDGGEEMSGTIEKDASLDDIYTRPIQRYVFTVEVTAEADGLTYTYRTQYRQMVKYDVRFMYGASRVPVVKEGNIWHISDVSGAEPSWGEGTLIQYEYMPGEAHVKSCMFENTYRKGGEGA